MSLIRQTLPQLKKNLKKDFSGLVPVKIALLGDTSTQLLCQALRGEGFENGFDLQVWEADYNQVQQQVFDPLSELYASAPDIVIIFQSTEKLLYKYNKTVEDKAGFAETEIAAIKNIFLTLAGQLKARIIFYNYPEVDDSVFGNYANKTQSSFLFQLRKLNYEMMLLASDYASFHVCDLSVIQNRFGRHYFFQPSIYVNTEMVLSMDVLPAIAGTTVDLIGAMYGKMKKCVILDLDNTIWGGIIGDDGMENIQIGNLGIGKAFTDFQYWIKKLKSRGIIIAVCSKNTEAIAKEPFEKHPDMVLELDDIAVFIANWENKIDNIKRIQGILNIGFDSMVFLDDNPFERNMVRENIPAITVPELPEDPADYLEYLYSLNLFETISFSEADSKRTQQYQLEAQRFVLQQKFSNEADFLQNLNMLSVVEGFTKFNTPRVAQLIQRSNQFNLRTVRYSENDVQRMAATENTFPFTFTLEDKFGDHGLVCVVILQKENPSTLFIDTWLMSCRVLKRGMEDFVLNTIAAFAYENNFLFLKGEYILTLKNEIVRNHYQNLGFTAENGFWLLSVTGFKKKESYIKTKKSKNGKS
jgi:FkbH-like protein